MQDQKYKYALETGKKLCGRTSNERTSIKRVKSVFSGDLFFVFITVTVLVFFVQVYIKLL